MQEEIENRSVNLAVSTSKLTARTIISAVSKYLRHRSNKKTEKQVKLREEANRKPVGKQTIQELIGQNQGVTSLDISATDLRGFEKYARKFGIDYAITMDKSGETPKYLVFFKARDEDALNACMKAYSVEALRKERRPSTLKKLARMKEYVRGLPTKVKTKTPTEPNR